MSNSACWIVGCLIVGLLVGCGQQGDEKTAGKTQAAKSPAKTAANTPAKPAQAATKGAAADDGIALAVLDHQGIVDLVASKRGKVVVVDCWSTSCDPCKAEFHNLVEIHQEHTPEKVACISVSTDFADLGPIDELKPEVRQFLASKQATFDNVLASEVDYKMYEKLEIPNGIPAVLVYDRTGKLAGKFTVDGSGKEGVSYDKVKQLVVQLLEP